MARQQGGDPILERFRDIPTALVTDAFLRLGFRGWMDGVLPLVDGSRITGRARTLAWGPVRDQAGSERACIR